MSKITSLQCLGLKDYLVTVVKVTPLSLIKGYPGKNFPFHCNLSIKQKIVQKFLKFLQILAGWGTFFLSPQNFFQILLLNFFNIMNT